MDWVAIGGRIRKQREYLGLTREQFAEKTRYYAQVLCGY